MKKSEEKRAFSSAGNQALACGIALLALAFTAAPALAEEYYICAEGESSLEIAEKAGVSHELLLAANSLEAAEALPAGQLLRIPSELLFCTTVQAGDSLSGLAARYGVSEEEIQKYNPLRADRLRAGMELHIPRGEETSVIPGSRAALPALASLSHRGERLFYPVAGSISSRFGPRRSSFHYGLDLAAEAGLSVQAAAGGLVTEAGWKNDAYGYTVMIDHGEGMETLYAHCSRLLVEEGQQVRAGEGIALVGSTGNSTGPHVHFEVRIQGECQDPLDYL